MENDAKDNVFCSRLLVAVKSQLYRLVAPGKDVLVQQMFKVVSFLFLQ